MQHSTSFDRAGRPPDSDGQPGIEPRRRLLTLREVAGVLGVSTQRAYELARKGLLPVVRMGRQLRVDSEQFDMWIADGGSGLK